MDDRMKDLFDRVRNTAAAMGEMAGEAARNASKYAGQVADTAKLNAKLLSVKADINGLLSQVGQMVYHAHTGLIAEDGELERLLQSLDTKYAEQEAVQAEIAQVRNGRQCPACGTLCAADDRFCKSCGAPQ